MLRLAWRLRRISRRRSWKSCTRTLNAGPKRSTVSSSIAPDSSTQIKQGPPVSGASISWVHVAGEPVGRHLVAEATLLGLAVNEGAGRGELEAQPDIVDETRDLGV